MYNPFDVLLFLRNREFKSYWFEIGTTPFLIDLMHKHKYYVPKFDDIVISESLMNSFDIDDMVVPAVLWQTGYLTIKDRIKRYHLTKYVLSHPNYEVGQALNEALLRLWLKNSRENEEFALQTLGSLEQGDMESLEKSLKSLYSSISYTFSQRIGE